MMYEEKIARIVERVVHETVPRSIFLRVVINQTPQDTATANGGKPLRIDQNYIETAKGGRFFDVVTTISDARIYRMTSYSDGEKCANLGYKPKEIERPNAAVISHEFMSETRQNFYDAPPPFRYYRVGLTPLAEALPTAERLGDETVIERPCDVFHFPDVKSAGPHQSLVFWLDKTSSVPLKVAAYKDPDHARRAGPPNWVWEALTFDTVNGRHMPLNSKYTGFLVKTSNDGKDTVSPNLSQTIKVEEIAFDTSYPSSTFWPTFPPGLHVIDTVGKRHVTIPGKPESSSRSESGTVASQTESPIQVDSPGDYSWFVGVGLMLSLALIAMALFIRRRSV